MKELNYIFKQINNKTFDVTCIKSKTLVNNELIRLEQLLQTLCNITKYKQLQIKLNTLSTIKDNEYNKNKVSSSGVFERGLKKINKKIQKIDNQLQLFERVKIIIQNRINAINNSYLIESGRKSVLSKVESCIVKNKDNILQDVLEM